MFRLKLTLKPKKKVTININYRARLNNLCHELIRFNRKRYVYSIEEKNKRDKLYYSPLFCKNYEVNDGKIQFKDDIVLYITSPSYSTVLDLIQGLYCKNSIKLEKAELEVISMELKSVNTTSKHSTNRKGNTLPAFNKISNDEIALMR
jgi:CRISPR/Cas system endoribonuclease Cas6 (RAMP superfamily)